MVGQGVLRECLLDPSVEQVLSINRSPSGQQDAKLAEIVHKDFFDFSAVESQLTGYDACFYCAGPSAAGMTEDDYFHATYDMTLAAAQTLARAKSCDDIYLHFRRSNGQHRKGPHHVGTREGQNGERATSPALQSCLYVPPWHHPAAARHSVKNERLSHLLRRNKAAPATSEMAVPAIRHHDRAFGPSHDPRGPKRLPKTHS